MKKTEFGKEKQETLSGKIRELDFNQNPGSWKVTVTDSMFMNRIVGQRDRGEDHNTRQAESIDKNLVFSFFPRSFSLPSLFRRSSLFGHFVER